MVGAEVLHHAALVAAPPLQGVPPLALDGSVTTNVVPSSAARATVRISPSAAGTTPSCRAERQAAGSATRHAASAGDAGPWTAVGLADADAGVGGAAAVGVGAGRRSAPPARRAAAEEHQHGQAGRRGRTYQM